MIVRPESSGAAIPNIVGPQAQVDWGHLGRIYIGGAEHKLWAFTLTLGYSRMMVAEAALDQKLRTLLRLLEAAFRQLDGVPQEGTLSIQKRFTSSSALKN